MDDAPRLLVKIRKLVSPLSDQDYRWLIGSLRRFRPWGDLSMAERAQTYRERHATVTVEGRDEHVTQQRDESVTPVTKRTKVLSSSEYSPGFCSFWFLYPKRIGKKEAFKAWNKGNCETISELVVQAVREQNGYLLRERGKFTPLPATWLNQGRWEDSPTIPKSQAQELWDEAQEEKRQRGLT